MKRGDIVEDVYFLFLLHCQENCKDSTNKIYLKDVADVDKMQAIKILPMGPSSA